MKLDLITDLPVLEQVEVNGVRHYTAEGVGPYPSVTTVLSSDKSKEDSIKKWRERVGEEEANRVSHLATQRGTAVHQIMEDYILDQDPITKPMPIHLATASKLKKWVDIYVGDVKLVEGQLFSHHLRTAGTVDLVAEWEGEMAIIDWKTSKYAKKRHYIENYFMQEAAYAVMFEERTGIPVKKLVTAVAYDEPNGGTQLFVENRDDWIDRFIELREMYDTQLQSMLQSDESGANTPDSRGVL
jgi:CRISPR/Cas system-associated exonuclease Cas4 (RecB family)